MHNPQLPSDDDLVKQFIIGSLERSIEDLVLTLREASFVRREAKAALRATRASLANLRASSRTTSPLGH
jgi:hypothetical protein